MVGLPGKLLLPGPCLLGLNTLFLTGSKRNHGGPRRSPGKPRRGVLQLPVHKFGILGYPYSSTPRAIQEQSIQAKETRPRQEELAGKANQGIPKNLPRRATRPGKATRPRQEELAGKTNQGISRPGERQASGRDKTTTAARRLPRQVTTLYPRSSASTNVLPWGFSRRVWQVAVQPAVRGGMRR